MKILIVDDSPPIRRDFVDLLKGFVELTIIEAENGLLGLEALEENKDTSLIISDIEMPVMDGFGFIEKVKSNEETDKIPVVFYTTQMSPSHTQKARQLGVKMHLPKPFTDGKKMIQMIEKILRTKLK